MFSIYSYADLTYHDHFGLIKKDFPDYSTAEKFLDELKELKLTSEHFDELVVCKTLETHQNEESTIYFDKEWMKDSYNELVSKYFGEVK